MLPKFVRLMETMFFMRPLSPELPADLRWVLGDPNGPLALDFNHPIEEDQELVERAGFGGIHPVTNLMPEEL
ncbi:MAG: hypothetical protein JNJ63_12280 [Hyphomonadaceae bacterium]|nr:hypothetical protein [Hyphomonadaceae bacterium]